MVQIFTLVKTVAGEKKAHLSRAGVMVYPDQDGQRGNLNVSQQCALAVKKANCMPGSISRSVASRARMGDIHTSSSALVKPHLACPVWGSLMQEGYLSRRQEIKVYREKRFCSALRKGSCRRDFEAAEDSGVLGYREDGARWFSELHNGRMRSIGQLQQGTLQLDAGRCFVRVVKPGDRLPREGVEPPSSVLSELTWTWAADLASALLRVGDGTR